MNVKNVLLVLSVVFSTVQSFAQNARKETSFRATSYNIRYAAKADIESGNGWDIRKEPLTKLIRTHGFDIVGTQEGDSVQLNDLKQLLPEFDIVKYPYGGPNANLHNCAILYKKTLFELIASNVFWLSETPDVKSKGWDADDHRICQWAKFKDKKSGKLFYMFNTHFYWRKQTARQQSGPLLAKKIKEIAGTEPVFVTGDFNSTAETAQIKSIKGILKDSYEITETPRQGVDGTAFPGGVFQGTPGGRIDYIFVSPHFRVLDYKVISDVYNGDHYPSDHLPVTSRLVF